MLALEPQVISWAEDFANKENALFLGAGCITHRTGRCAKLKEITYIHAEAYAAGSNGPAGAGDERDAGGDTVAPNDPAGKAQEQHAEVRARGGAGHVLADADTRIEAAKACT